jgi:sulfotransferase
MKIFFNSSMPRSGSTLLQNILGNNPNIYATPTSGLLEMLNASKRVYTSSLNFKAQDEAEMKKAFLMYSHYAIHGYFNGITDRPYAIDKSRGWAISIPYLESFYEKPKVICMVRDLRDIVASMEKNYRKFPDKWDVSDDEPFKGATLGERVTKWMNPESKPVGHTLNNLKEVFHRGNDKKMLFVKFEELSKNPENEMRRVYEYLELPYYHIDYNNVKQVTFEDDRFHGRYGQHKIQPQIKPLISDSKNILGDIICRQLYEKNEWYFKKLNY